MDQKNRFKWVLFDMYDTLAIVHSGERFMIENKLLWKAFKKHGMELDRQTLYEKLAEIKERIPQNKPGISGAERIQLLAKEFDRMLSFDVAEQIHRAQYADKRSCAKLSKETKPLLNWLKKKKFKIALISNAHTPGLLKNLHQLKIHSYFDEIIVSDAVQGLKSELIPFKAFLERHAEVHPHECLMVGDSLTEDAAAQKVGIPAAIFEHSLIHYSRKRLDELKEKGALPKYRINNLEDVKEILERADE